MKKYLLLIPFFVIQMVSAQETSTVANDSIYNTAGIEVKPEYPDGIGKFYQFIGDNYKNPTGNSLNGSIYLSFVVNTEGTIDRVKILKNNGYGTGEEAIRVLAICPKWKPGEQNGKKLSYKYYLTILINGTSVSCLPISEKSLQDDTKESYEIIYDTRGIDLKPEFPGGYQEFYKFIARNYNTPKVKGMKGKIYVTFVVEKDGNIDELLVLKDLGYGTGEEAIRVLELSPKWKSGELNGQKVRTRFSLPISIESK